MKIKEKGKVKSEKFAAARNNFQFSIINYQFISYLCNKF